MTELNLGVIGVGEPLSWGAGEPLVVVGCRAQLMAPWLTSKLPEALRAVWPAMIDALEPGDAGTHTTTWLCTEPPGRVSVGMLPDVSSRHNAVLRVDAMRRLLSTLLGSAEREHVLIVLGDSEHTLAAAACLARVVPRRRRSAQARGPRELAVRFAAPDGVSIDLDALRPVIDGVAKAADLHDAPANELHPAAFVEQAQRVAEELGVRCHIVVGDALREQGLGGLWAVGRAAEQPPALIVLSHLPPEASRSVCWVGKGVVYDTGGLSLKSLAEMRGMKGDMAGAGAVLAAFQAAVRLGCRDALHAVLCVAENAIGPGALRPDDIITLRSGKRVEITNTDAEGRLLLGDGVAHAVEYLKPDVLVDLATLTDGQRVATGRLHAAIVSNDAALEARAVQSGRSSGDLVHALPYCPELWRDQFRSAIADMTNYARDRGTADASTAAQFIAEHLGPYAGPWLHVDMDAPARDPEERATGFGVALLLRMFDYV